MRSLCIVIILSLFPLLGFAQNSIPIVEGWDVPDSSSIRIRSTPPPQSFFVSLTNSAISLYQRDISTQSISRCPFEISCSRFAIRSIADHGVFGVALFIDRYFYRENIESFINYKLIKTNNGLLKLDDKLYLFE